MPESAASFTLKGTKEMRAKMDRIAKKFPDQVKGALATEAELILTDAKIRTVPWDLGTLVNSGHTTKPTKSGKDLVVHIRFGGAAAPYALAIHEHPSSASPPSWQGKVLTFRGKGTRGTKYLERPLKKAEKGFLRRVSRSIKP